MTQHNRWIFAALTFVLSVTACTIVVANASAQSKDHLLVMGDAAKRALSNGDISGEAAAKLTQGCQDFAAQHNFAAAIAVLDQTGNIVHSHRMDGVRPDEIQSAYSRARAALFNRNATNNEPSSDITVVGLVNVVRGSLGHGFDTSPGGVPIVLDGQMIGAVGVAGSDSLNADCARAGIAAVSGLTAVAPR